MGSYGLHDSESKSSFAMELQICDLKIGKTGKAFKITDSLASRPDATFPSFSFLKCG
jgi:hypothetical protein